MLVLVSQDTSFANDVNGIPAAWALSLLGLEMTSRRGWIQMLEQHGPEFCSDFILRQAFSCGGPYNVRLMFNQLNNPGRRFLKVPARLAGLSLFPSWGTQLGI